MTLAQRALSRCAIFARVAALNRRLGFGAEDAGTTAFAGAFIFAQRAFAAAAILARAAALRQKQARQDPARNYERPVPVRLIEVGRW